jgi:hypothetical protein
MFSPMGKKKILLEQRYVGTSAKGGSLERGRRLSDCSSVSLGSAGSVGRESEEEGSPGPKRRRSTQKAGGDSIASSSHLQRALTDMEDTGRMMRKIQEATVRYRPEKDAVILKAFQSNHIEYDKFRAYLYSAFWLAFDESEFVAFLGYFDPTNDKGMHMCICVYVHTYIRAYVHMCIHTTSNRIRILFPITASTSLSPLPHLSHLSHLHLSHTSPTPLPHLSHTYTSPTPLPLTHISPTPQW